MTTTEHEDVADVHHQPALPAFELPDYHGRRPASMRTTLTGAGTRVTRSHTIGDRLVLVIEARVKSAAHEETDDGLVYVEKLKVLDLFELDRDQGSRLISTVRSLYRTAEDAVKGRRPVPGLGETGYTDASGVVLTPAEVAELRGDPIRSLLSPELQPAVIVYEDGARDLWPDDYPRDAPRPKPGEKYLTDSGDVEVVKLLHHETGEELVTQLPAEVAPEEPAPELVDEAPAEPPARAEELEDPFPSNVTQLRPSSPAPDLPEPDAFSGDLGDNVAGWETPDPATEQRIAESTFDPAGLLKRTAPKLAEALAEISSTDELEQLFEWEKTHRRRKNTLAAIERRISEVVAV